MKGLKSLIELKCWQVPKANLTFLFLLTFLIGISVQAENSSNNETFSNGHIAFVGDSLTHDGPWSTTELCLNDFRNAGVGGDGTTEVLARIPDILSTQPQKIVITLGVNDLNWAHRKHQRDKNLNQYLNKGFLAETSTNPKHQSFSGRYRQIIMVLQNANPKPHIIMTSVLPIDDAVYRANKIAALNGAPGWDTSFITTNKQIDKMNATLRKIAGHHNVDFVDMNRPFKDFIRNHKNRFGVRPFDHTGVHFLDHGNHNLSYSRKPHYVLWADLIRPQVKLSPYNFDPDVTSKKTACD